MPWGFKTHSSCIGFFRLFWTSTNIFSPIQSAPKEVMQSFVPRSALRCREWTAPHSHVFFSYLTLMLCEAMKESALLSSISIPKNYLNPTTFNDNGDFSEFLSSPARSAPPAPPSSLMVSMIVLDLFLQTLSHRNLPRSKYHSLPFLHSSHLPLIIDKLTVRNPDLHKHTRTLITLIPRAC